MRIIIDSLIAFMVVGVVVGLVMLNRDRQQDEREVVRVQTSLDRLNEQAAYHTAVQSALAGQDMLLVHMHAAWFGEDLPTNVLIGQDNPWIDLAPPGDLGVHPPDPVVTNDRQAGFWYNPTTGVFRARVKQRSTEAKTLALYNDVNQTDLEAFEQIPDPSRSPIAHVPGTTPARQYASMANRTWSVSEPDPAEVSDQLFEPLIESLKQEEQVASTPALVEPSDGIYEAHTDNALSGVPAGDQSDVEDEQDEAASEELPTAEQPRPKLEK